MSAEAEERKQRSIAILKAEGVPYIDWLPTIETQEGSVRRHTEEVAIRAMALCVVAVKGEGLEQDIIEDITRSYGLEPAFTPKELAFIKNHDPSGHDRVQFAWRYECYNVLLWATKYLAELERPDHICDVASIVSILHKSDRDRFIANAELRPQNELLDAADLIYRYHWAVRNANLSGKTMPAGLDGGVVMERHHALNWLIGYGDQDWDDVSTDT